MLQNKGYNFIPIFQVKVKGQIFLDKKYINNPHKWIERKTSDNKTGRTYDVVDIHVYHEHNEKMNDLYEVYIPVL